MYRVYRVPHLFLLVFMAACTASPDTTIELTSAPTPVTEQVSDEPMVKPMSTNPTDASGLPVANVVSVAVTGEAQNYTFAVTISSADTGCEQYADWWEVVDAQTGDLLYRRILAHSHVNEQPFTRSGGPVPIDADQAVLIRGHMGGMQNHYGGQVFGGTIEASFQPVTDALPGLETVEPLPKGCAF